MVEERPTAQNEKANESGSNSAPSAATMLSDLLLTREEVAALLKVRAKTVDYLHRTKRLEAVKVGKANRWKPDAVREYVARLGSE